MMPHAMLLLNESRAKSTVFVGLTLNGLGHKRWEQSFTRGLLQLLGITSGFSSRFLLYKVL